MANDLGEMKLYRGIDVWARRSEREVVCYRCLQILPDELYCVQSSDFFHLPVDPEEVRLSQKNFVELLAEEAPEVRSPLLPSLPEAIRAHEAEFL